MRRILILMLGLNSVLHAQTLISIPVADVLRTELEAVFELDTEEVFSKVTLDCQSFLHGINIYDEDDHNLLQFYLYQPECHEVLNFVWSRKDTGKHSCIKLDLDKSAYELLESCD